MNEIILLIEDNEDIMKINRSALLRRSYRMLEATTLHEAETLLLQETPDLLVLDIMLPDGSGFDFCRRLRRVNDVPLLFLTALGETEDMLNGLALGGDDYLPKPYDLDVFCARVEALLRRERRHKEKVRTSFNIGALSLQIQAHKALLDGEDMLLTQKEFGVLLLLAESEGRVLPAETLYKSVWQQPLIEDTQALKSTISRLRKKLCNRFTITVKRGGGYRLDIITE